MVILIGTLHGIGGVICLIAVMGFESIMYPIIFVLGTANLGRHTRRAAGLLVMGVAGGAVFPPIQGGIADAANTKVSFFVAVPCFAYIFAWALWVWNKDGRQWTPTKPSHVTEPVLGAQTFATGLGYEGRNENYEGSIKEDLERVEKA
jgi:FHS family L-fucose permease-like MFS transporter